MTRRVALAAASGLLWACSFPGWHVRGWEPWTGWVAWVALVPALIAFEDATPRQAALAGWAGGFAGWASALTWLLAIRELEFLSVPAWLAFAAVLGLYGAAWGWLVARGRGAGLAVAPATWTLVEWLRGRLFSGFAWIPLGASQVAGPRAVSMGAAVVGVLGLSLIVAVVNAGIWTAWRRPAERRRGMVAVAAALFAALALGRWGERTALMRPEGGAGRIVRVGLLQGGFTEAEKWTLPAAVMVRRYEDLGREAARRGATIMVWPETATAAVLNRDPVQLTRVARLAARTGSLQLVGALEQDESTGVLYNGITAVTRAGAVAAYRKTHLVPFGEYIPPWFRVVAPFASKVTAGLVDLSPARSLSVLHVPDGPAVGALVCYEIVFPEPARRLARAGAEVVVNVTNDAWYWRTAATWQHALGARARAMETGLWVVRCANTGATMVVDPLGRPRVTLGLLTSGVQVEDVRLGPATAPYVRFGDLPVLLLAAALFLSARRRAAAHAVAWRPTP